MPDLVKLDNRVVAVAVRVGRFAAATGMPATACPYTGDDGAQSALRRVWLASFLRTRPPGSDTDKPVKAAAATAVQPDFEQLELDHAQAVTTMATQWQGESGPLAEALVAATVAEIAGGALVGLGMLTVSPAVVAPLTGVVTAGMLTLAAAAATLAAAELAAAGVTVAASLPRDSQTMIRRQGKAIAGLIANGYASAAAREALRQVGADIDPDSVGAAVRVVLADISVAKGAGLVAGNLAAAASTAQAEGRRAVFDRLPEGTRYQASERLDRSACTACKANDGRIYSSLADALRDYPTGKLRSCAGRDRCRGMLVPILA